MENRIFKKWNRIVSLAVLAVASFTYIATIEPSASFWDCGEFIASSYKLEVGHPPGNPVFQLIARFFTMFTDGAHAAIAVNLMSALCSAFTIFLLYLTCVFFAKRMLSPDENGLYSKGRSIAIFGSSAVGALAYCFSDTFWFSAVEGEVYAMSSLVTALVFWAMTKWYEQADRPGANRWIVLISFLMGLSIGIHLLNLLAIPALVFMFYYKKREEGVYTFWEMIKIFLLSLIILGAILAVIIPGIPKLAAVCDRFCVNTLGHQVNTGAAMFTVLLLALCFIAIYMTFKAGKVVANTILLCFTSIVIGFSIFSVIIIRSSVMTPTNENQPDNAYSLVRYLSREQYGSQPLLYGQYFDAPYDVVIGDYWALVDGKYKKVPSPMDAEYDESGKMLFPRMWSGGDQRYIDFYLSYTHGDGIPVRGAKYKKPTFWANLAYFFDYQCNWMYWRYFMWNFAGRQNDIHSPVPGNRFYGNWESGITALDQKRLGDQSGAPAILSENKAKNHYYMLPLILGIIGLCVQYARDRRGCWLVFLMFFMTGIAVVVYLNQPPYQVRERDYAYAGSFYMFAMWIGFAVIFFYENVFLRAVGKIKAALVKDSHKTACAVAASALCLCVPALMAQQNWDDHDRSNRKTAVELARNYLNSTGEQGLLVTHGDNDTFPIWYAQEVEEIRQDVRVCNTSLLGTDWYIGQMKYACNTSKPLDLQVSQSQYLYGTNDFVYIYDTRKQVIPIADVMRVFRHPQAKLPLTDGRKVDYIVSRKISIPVNKENALRCGIVPEKFSDLIEDEIILEIPKEKDYITKQELFILDFLSTYKWDRPLNLLSQGGDINIGLKKYLVYEGFSTKLVPFRNSVSSSKGVGVVDSDALYDKMMNVYTWDALKRQDYFVDYQNLITFIGTVQQREIFRCAARIMLDEGKKDKAIAILDKCQESVPASTYPLETIILGFPTNDLNICDMVAYYYEAGAPEKAFALAEAFGWELIKTTVFMMDWYDEKETETQYCMSILYDLCKTLKKNGAEDLAEQLNDAVEKKINAMMAVYGSDLDELETITKEDNQNS